MQISSNIHNENPVNLLNFTDFSSLQNLNTNKPYTAITTCVLEHIFTTTNLCDLEKLFYTIADSLSLINHNQGKQRSITLSARQWAKKLDCSVAEIFAMQQSLEEKGYFEISRGMNKEGKNKKNIITPTLPDSVFNSLVNTPNRFNIGTYSTDRSLSANFTSTAYLPNLEGKRAYLDRTKMFIKLNYDLLLLINSCKQLTKFSKVLWLDFFTIGYRYYLKHRGYNKNTTELGDMDILDNIQTDDYVNYIAPHDSYSLTTTYKELQDKYSCSKSVISKTLKELETSGFITRQRFFVKNDDEDDNLHDKSIWRITVTLPNMMQQQLQKESKDRSKPSSGRVVSNSGPYVLNSSQYINKYFIPNIKDLDSIDSEKSFFEKTNDFSSETSSELSEFYKNSLKEEKIVIIETTPPIIKTQESILDIETSNNLPNETLEVLGEISDTVRGEQEKIPLLKPLNEQSSKEISDTTSLVNTKSATSVAAVTSIQNKYSSIQAKPLTHKKPPTQAKSLKCFYPLTKEQVNKINQSSSREFSNNFANQLLLKLYIRDPNKSFASRNHMISYMSKAFRYEKHQAPMVNHETFRFTANVSDPESVSERQREKHLAEVEYSLDTSYLSQLRRKIASIFEPKLAYRLLTEVEYKCEYQEEEELLESQDVQTQQQAQQQEQGSQEFNEFKKLLSATNIAEYACTIQLPEDLVLTYPQEETLENAIISLYGKIDINYEKIATQSGGTYKKSPVNSEINLEDLDPNSVWYKIRKELKTQLYDGKFVDKAWFSKLTAEENVSNNTITLYAPSNFIRDYVNHKYGFVIRQIAKGLGYQFVELVDKKTIFV